MSHWTLAICGRFARDSDDLNQLFGSELGRATRSRFVLEDSDHELCEFPVANRTSFRRGEARPMRSPSPTPTPDTLTIDSQLIALLDVIDAVR